MGWDSSQIIKLVHPIKIMSFSLLFAAHWNTKNASKMSPIVGLLYDFNYVRNVKIRLNWQSLIRWIILLSSMSVLYYPLAIYT